MEGDRPLGRQGPNDTARFVLRKRFSAFQLDILEDAFQRDSYLNSTVLDDLHGRLRMSVNQIKIWFRDRRRKWRKEQETARTLSLEEQSTGILHSSSTKDPAIAHTRCRSKRMKIINLKCHQKSCQVLCPTKTELNRHLMHSHAVLPFPCQVIGCDRAYPYSHQLSTHTRVVHPNDDGEAMWQCAYCHKRFSCYNHLRVHVIRMHEEGNFECGHEGCNFISSTREELQRHNYKVHIEAKFQCQHPNCERLFKTKANRKIHQSSHLNARQKRGLQIAKNAIASISNCSQSEKQSAGSGDCLNAKPTDISYRTATGKNNCPNQLTPNISNYLEAFSNELEFSNVIECKEREIKEWICQQVSPLYIEDTDHTYCRKVDNYGVSETSTFPKTASNPVFMMKSNNELGDNQRAPSPTHSVVYAGSLLSKFIVQCKGDPRAQRSTTTKSDDSHSDMALLKNNSSGRHTLDGLI